MAQRPKLKNNIKVYEPNHILKSGIRVWSEMFQELYLFRGLIWRMSVRDITARYKQSILGILWAFLTPLVLLIVFVWIKEKGILPIKNTVMPYSAFVFTGQIVWLLFSYGMTSSANSLVVAGSMLTKVNFPREVLIFSALGQTVFEFLIRIPLLFIIFVWVGFSPKLTILLVPFALLPLLLLVAGLGFIIALLNALLRDVSSFLGIILNLGMFVTPVIYPPPTTWPFSFLINHINPISGFVTATRDLISLGSLTDPPAYLSAVIVSFLLFFLGWRLFHLVEPQIAERS